MFGSIVKRSPFVTTVINNRGTLSQEAKKPVDALLPTVSAIKCLKMLSPFIVNVINNRGTLRYKAKEPVDTSLPTVSAIKYQTRQCIANSLMHH